VLDGHTLKAIPIFVFCFTCQQVGAPIITYFATMLYQ
jgi:amino acid permease